MWYTLITQRGEVSGFVRILHQVLGYHMTKHTVYIPPVHILPLHAMHAHHQYTDTTIVLVLYCHWVIAQLITISQHYKYCSAPTLTPGSTTRI